MIDPVAGEDLVAIALGSNLGDRAAILGRAVAAIAALDGVRVLAASAWIETDPVGPPGQGPYLNGAVLAASRLAPRTLLEALLAIERSEGRDRDREPRWGPRTLDLDLLLHGDRIVREEGLEVPHPRMPERRFVLEPLATVAGHLVHPERGRTIRELLEALDGDAGLDPARIAGEAAERAPRGTRTHATGSENPPGSRSGDPDSDPPSGPPME